MLETLRFRGQVNVRKYPTYTHLPSVPDGTLKPRPAWCKEPLLSTQSVFRARRLGGRERSDLLRSIVRASERHRGQQPPVLVFDLDGTLLDNRPRFVRILHELAESWAATHPELSKKLECVTAEQIVYGLRENLVALGIDDPSVEEEAFEFWKARFFVDAYMKYDVATKGAVELANESYRAGATLVYLTGRDLPNMAVGTFASLRDLGFPIGVVGTALVTKPAFEIPDADFKREVAPNLDRHGRVEATFDNEPANTNLFIEHHPQARNVFLDTHHAPAPPALDARALIIDSFELE